MMPGFYWFLGQKPLPGPDTGKFKCLREHDSIRVNHMTFPSKATGCFYHLPHHQYPLLSWATRDPPLLDIGHFLSKSPGVSHMPHSEAVIQWIRGFCIKSGNFIVSVIEPDTFFVCRIKKIVQWQQSPKSQLSI